MSSYGRVEDRKLSECTVQGKASLIELYLAVEGFDQLPPHNAMHRSRLLRSLANASRSNKVSCMDAPKVESMPLASFTIQPDRNLLQKLMAIGWLPAACPAQRINLQR